MDELERCLVAALQVDGRPLGVRSPATVGLLHALSYPVLRYFRTIRGRRSGLLTDVQVAALVSEFTVDTLHSGDPGDPGALSARDNRITEALIGDGRAGMEAVARCTGVPETIA